MKSFPLLLCLSAALIPTTPLLTAAEKGGLSGLLVEVTRGPLIESRHYGRLVVVTPEGEIVRQVGDPHALMLSRSALKPLQALGTVKLALDRGEPLSLEEIAVMCGSHRAQEYHLDAVAALLERAGAGEAALHCGEVRGDRQNHNCSGKHGGMLVGAKLAGAPREGYWEIDHPVQKLIQKTIREFTDYDEPRPLPYGTDGCGAPNYATPLYNLALGFARIANPDRAPEAYREAARAVRDAILAHPGHLSSHDSFHARLVEAGNGRVIGKTGAEACYGLGLAVPALGLAVKIEDGNTRGMQAILLAAMDRLGGMTHRIDRELGDQRATPIENSRGAIVGEIRAAEW